MTSDDIKRVRIYLNQRDQFQNQPLYLLVLERLQREGATGATALQGLAGFGPGQRTRATGLGANETLPVVVEWIDRAERIARTLPTLQDLVPRAMITLEEVQVYHAVMRAVGPFVGDDNVGKVMHTEMQRLTLDAQLGAALDIMLDHHQYTVPIVDEQQHILGVITEQEILTRAGMTLPLRLLRLLSAEERRVTLAPFVLRPVEEIMNTEPRSVYAGSSLPQALVTMIEWNYEQVPVTDRTGMLSGILGANDLLRTVVEQSTDTDGVEDAEPSTRVSLVMQSIVPHVHSDQPLHLALQQLLTTSHRYLIVTDEERCVYGSISDEDMLQRLSGTERSAWLAALRDGVGLSVDELPEIDRPVGEIAVTDISTVQPGIPIIEAARLLLDCQVERVPVVDEEGKLMGLLGRSGLLRALLQETQ